MRIREAIASALQALALFLAAGAALFFFALPFVPEVRIKLADALLSSPRSFWLAGSAFLFLTALFLFGFYGSARGYFLVLRMGGNTLSIDEKVLFQTIEPELSKRYRAQLRLDQVSILRRKHLTFTLTSPLSTTEELEPVLQSAEAHLQTLLKERFGYRRAFTVRLLSRRDQSNHSV